MGALDAGVHNFPEYGTERELEDIGARYLQTKQFKLEGKFSRIEYMVYQDPQKIIVWKRWKSEDLFRFHTETEITKRCIIKPQNQLSA